MYARSLCEFRLYIVIRNTNTIGFCIALCSFAIYIFWKNHKTNNRKSLLFCKTTCNFKIKSFPILKPGGKHLITNKNCSSVAYTFQCCCESNYIGQTSTHLITRIKEHVPKCVENFIQNPVELKCTAIKNAMNKSVISEHLVNNPTCGKSYKE